MLIEIATTGAALPSDQRTALGVTAVAQHCQMIVEAALARPARDPNDWSIAPFASHGCCDDCASLAAFLTDPTAITLTWPLAKPRRQHIHHRIDDAELPVTHRTIRQGSPHKLVLVKTADLHRREADQRRQMTDSLAAVERCLELRH